MSREINPLSCFGFSDADWKTASFPDYSYHAYASPIATDASGDRRTDPDALESSSAQDFADEHDLSEQATTEDAAFSRKRALIDIPPDVTTLVVRNVPLRYTQDDILDTWDAQEYDYDYLHLPMSYNLGRITIYAFVNFSCHESAVKFHHRWHGFFMPEYDSPKSLSISVANSQGLKPNLGRFDLEQLEEAVLHGTAPVTLYRGVRVDPRVIYVVMGLKEEEADTWQRAVEEAEERRQANQHVVVSKPSVKTRKSWQLDKPVPKLVPLNQQQLWQQQQHQYKQQQELQQQQHRKQMEQRLRREQLQYQQREQMQYQKQWWAHAEGHNKVSSGPPAWAGWGAAQASATSSSRGGWREPQPRVRQQQEPPVQQQPEPPVRQQPEPPGRQQQQQPPPPAPAQVPCPRLNFQVKIAC